MAADGPRLHRCVLLGLSLALLGVPSVASASFLDAYGFDSRAVAMGGAQSAVADDFTGLFYNPAALTSLGHAVWGAGFMASRPGLGIHYDRADGVRDELEAPNATAVTFGGLFPLTGPAAPGRIALAFALSVPTRSLLNGQALDPATPHWYMYTALPERLVSFIGIGVQPVDWLSLGLSIQFLAGLSGKVDYDLDIVAGRFTKKAVLFDIEPVAAPVAGIEVRPLEDLRVGLSYRAAIDGMIDIPVNVSLTGLAELDVTTILTVQYTPHELTLGASYRLRDLDLLIACDASLAFWSGAPDPSSVAAIDVSGELVEGAGLGSALDAPAEGQARTVDLGFRDVIVPRLGIEKGLGDFVVRGGYAIRPSPAPLQTSGTNYIDGTAHHFSVGGGVRFSDPFGLLANPIAFDLSALWVFLPERRHEKIDPLDPVGSYGASGSILVFGIGFRYGYQERELADEQP